MLLLLLLLLRGICMRSRHCNFAGMHMHISSHAHTHTHANVHVTHVRHSWFYRCMCVHFVIAACTENIVLQVFGPTYYTRASVACIILWHHLVCVKVIWHKNSQFLKYFSIVRLCMYVCVSVWVCAFVCHG